MDQREASHRRAAQEVRFLARGCRCSCGRHRNFRSERGPDGAAFAAEYAEGIDLGLWRGLGSFVPRAAEETCQAPIEVCDARLTRVCVPEWLRDHPRPWHRCGRKRWDAVEHELLPLDERGPRFTEVFALYNAYQSARDPSAILTREGFVALVCTSPIGSVTASVAEGLTRAVARDAAGEPTAASKHAGACAGSCISVLRWQGRVVACMLLDLVGRDGGCGTVLGTKLMWYEVPGARQSAVGQEQFVPWPTSVVELLWYKHLVFAGQLRCAYVWNGYSDPMVPKLLYKLERFWQHSEAQTTDGWLPLKECMERDADGVLRWSPRHANLTKLSGARLRGAASASLAEEEPDPSDLLGVETANSNHEGSPQAAATEASETPKEVRFETTVSDGATAMTVAGDTTFCGGDRLWALRPNGSKGFCSSRCFAKKDASWLLLEEEIGGVAAMDPLSPRLGEATEETVTAKSWFLLDKVRAFAGAEPLFAGERAAQGADQASTSDCGSTADQRSAAFPRKVLKRWFPLEHKVLLCALGMSCETPKRSARRANVDTVTCWAVMGSLFDCSVA